jgi:hypothetical protein
VPATPMIGIQFISIQQQAFPGNLRMQGDSGIILGQLLAELKKKARPKFTEAAKKRVQAHAAERKAWRAQAAKLATN